MLNPDQQRAIDFKVNRHKNAKLAAALSSILTVNSLAAGDIIAGEGRDTTVISVATDTDGDQMSNSLEERLKQNPNQPTYVFNFDNVQERGNGIWWLSQDGQRARTGEGVLPETGASYVVDVDTSLANVGSVGNTHNQDWLQVNNDQMKPRNLLGYVGSPDDAPVVKMWIFIPKEAADLVKGFDVYLGENSEKFRVFIAESNSDGKSFQSGWNHVSFKFDRNIPTNGTPPNWANTGYVAVLGYYDVGGQSKKFEGFKLDQLVVEPR